MPESQGLTDRVVNQVVEMTIDHQQLLADFELRLEPLSNELVETWTNIFRSASVRRPLPPDPVIHSVQEETVGILIGELRNADLPRYFSNVAGWAYRTARSGLSYDRVILLVREYQRSILLLLGRVYQPGPEMELVLAALDELYSGILTLVGAAYIEAAHEQLIDSAHLRALGQLTSGATHALNNLHTGILGRTQLLFERARDPELRNELSEIQRSAAGSAQMVRRLQDYARITRDEKMIETDVNALIREAAEITRFIWRDQSEVNGIVIDVVKDLTDMPPVLCRTGEIRQVLVELILNSVEAMPRGGLITLRTERKGDDVLMSVIDTGEGMTEDTRLRVMDSFFTTKGPGHAGLGLSTVADIVARHSGIVKVESVLGQGSTLTVSLPIAAGVADQKRERIAMADHAVKILIIDDEPTVRDIVAKFLAFRGYQVAVADNGKDGIAAFKKADYDLVVTDLGMPGMSGWEVAREVKRLNDKSLVVLMSGWAADLDAQKVRESGVDRVVHKPFDVDEVLAMVNEAAALKERM